MKYTILPPQEIPKGLTAYHPPENLLDHALGFESINGTASVKRNKKKSLKTKVVAEIIKDKQLALTEKIEAFVPPLPISLFFTRKFNYLKLESICSQNSDFDGDPLGIILSGPHTFKSEPMIKTDSAIRKPCYRHIGESEIRIY